MVTDPWAAREKGISDYHKRISESARHKQQAPQRTWDKLESLTNQAVSGPLDASQEQELKETRRLWNREHKNTPVGIMASGVDLGAAPFGAQDLYHDMSSLMYHDQPEMYDRMYPLNPTRLVSGLAENIGPGGWLNKILPKRERKVPANVLAMRDRFPGINIDEVIPQKGIARTNIVPEHIQKSALWGIHQDRDEGKGIFYGGRGELSPDFDYEGDRESRELSAKIAFLESVNPNVDYDNILPELIDELYEKALEGERGDEVISEIIPEGEDKVISNVSEIFENSETFNKNYGLSTSYGEVLPESYAPGTTAYSLFQQLKAGFEDMSNDEILQKMIDNDMIKERP